MNTMSKAKSRAALKGVREEYENELAKMKADKRATKIITGDKVYGCMGVWVYGCIVIGVWGMAHGIWVALIACVASLYHTHGLAHSLSRTYTTHHHHPIHTITTPLPSPHHYHHHTIRTHSTGEAA
jgi:hypothetical protein